MAFLVTCTFDLKNATATDYENAYSDLAKIGLGKVVVGSSGSKVVAPTTMTIGEFNGTNAGGVGDDLRDRVRRAFGARSFSSEIFVVVGGDWAWGCATT